MEGLVIALTRQVQALRARHGIEVELKLCEEPDAPYPVKEALYRIAQEALQNAIKHARPTRLEVRLEYLPDGLSSKCATTVWVSTSKLNFQATWDCAQCTNVHLVSGARWR